MIDFKVNAHTTINKFELLNEYTEFKKFGVDVFYQRFTGQINKKHVAGWQCVDDLNIYKLEYIN